MSNSNDAPTLEIEYRLLGRTGKTLFVCDHGDTTMHQATIDLSAARHAEKVDKFVDAVCKACPNEVERDRVKQLMASRVTEAFNALLLNDTGDDGFTSKSQATELVELADGAYLFCIPDTDPEAYATLTKDENRRTWPVRSMGFRRWLTNQFYQRHEKAPGSQALQDAVNTITARAVSGGKVHNVHARLARRADSIWLDLGDDAGTAVEVMSTGWRIVTGAKVPVAFIRRRGMLALPQPISGGSIEDLRQFVNVANDDDWQLLVGWMIAALRPGFPFPILDVTGEQGSAKTTTTRVLRKVVDPNRVPARSLPREPRDLFIAANNAWVFAIDNVSGLTPWQSDCLCVLATGGGFGTRSLYTDDDEQLFDVMRPVLLNGISTIIERSDLMDRSMSIVLPRIVSTKRIPEEEFWVRFEACHPRLLGAFLDAVSVALANQSSVTLTTLPRMADLARWVTAAESALAWEPGTFLRSYVKNRSTAHVMAVETAAIGPALVEFAEALASEWCGRATELLGALEQRADERTTRRKGWPRTPASLGKQLRRLAPDLREIGVGIEFRRDGDREIVISAGSPQAEPTSRSAPGTDGSDGKSPHSSDAAEESIQDPSDGDADDPEVLR